ncbi:kinase-like domain-containing protein [Bombardia bombarda]|uniref:Kinase-like domain-containing protein n=1 Tax=Bombardia bombarda TaxID=252184 RepID=A0AA40BVB2_9PEZI|nr:kinase-like domain-containing protein [Bombardia bombarda]
MASSHTDRRRIGLDDPRVTTCYDRGDAFYSQDHPMTRPHNPSLHAADESNLTATMISELEESQIAYPSDRHSSLYVPRERLKKIIDPERVLLLIKRLRSCQHMSPADQSRLRDNICYADGPCWRLLLILLYTGTEEELLNHIAEGVSDKCLPLSFGPEDDTSRPCGIKDHHHPTMGNWTRKNKREASQLSYAVKAVYFKHRPDGHVHYVLDSNDVLPIFKVKDIASSDAPKTQQKNAAENDSASGGFGEVKKVEFETSHFNFGPLGVSHPKAPSQRPQFALKTLISMSRDSFNKELASLLSFQDEKDKHLIRLLATFEVRTRQNGCESATYHLLFPWAQGDLWHFWKLHEAEGARIPRCVWMAEQCYFVARALMHVHKERGQLLRLSDIDENKHELFGRHGDVKADNILWFEGEDILVMTDFGLGRLHTKYSRSVVDPKLLDKSATYRAPEFDLRQGLISRASDIFSLGCMYLEFVTWYLEGWDSVRELFPEQRIEEDVHKIESDTFFKIEDHKKDKERAVLKPKVRQWVKRLKQSSHSSKYIEQFLDLIENHMLAPEPKNRIKSPKLVKELEMLSIACRRDSSFYKPSVGRL